MAYGREGFQSIVENSISNAQNFGSYLDKSDALELKAPVRLNVVCFGLKRSGEKTAEFLSVLNSRGKVFMTATLLDGKLCIRAAFVNYRTTQADIAIVIEELEAVCIQLF